VCSLEVSLGHILQNLLLQRQLRHQPFQLAVFPLQFFQTVRLIRLERTCFISGYGYREEKSDTPEGGRAPPLKSRSLGMSAVLVLTVVAGTARIAAQSTRDTDVREFKRLETVWNEAQERDDVDALARLWADDIEVAVPKMPVLTKADALKFARSGRMKFSSYKTSDIRVRVYGNAAVVTGRLQRTRSMNGQETSDDWRFTKTYIREAQQWRVVAFHASESAQP
jgi:ketosteroid isomerase-like protein